MNPCQVNITPLTRCFYNPQAEQLSRVLLTKSPFKLPSKESGCYVNDYL